MRQGKNCNVRDCFYLQIERCELSDEIKQLIVNEKEESGFYERKTYLMSLWTYLDK